MNCPRCETSALDERERDGMTIDVCRACRGVWLDRGELEKLIARAARDLDDHDRGHSRDDSDDSGDWRRRDGRADDDRRSRPHRKRRWYESLGDLFD